MLGTLADGRFSLEEIHRFPNGAARLMGTLHWDMPRLFEELKTGLRKVGRMGVPAASVSVDSWGVDYAFLNKDKLAQFYADRTLTESPTTPADQAEAYFLCVSQRLSKTTGQIITVDGGLHEAFPR